MNDGTLINCMRAAKNNLLRIRACAELNAEESPDWVLVTTLSLELGRHQVSGSCRQNGVWQWQAAARVWPNRL